MTDVLSPQALAHERELYAQSMVGISAGGSSSFKNRGDIVNAVPYGLEGLKVASKQVLTAKNAFVYLAPGEGEQPNHFKTILPETDAEGKVTKLILADPYGVHWSEKELKTIRESVGEGVELAYLGTDGKAKPLNTPEEQLAMLQRNGERDPGIEHDGSNCGALASFLASGWNAKDKSGNPRYRGEGHNGAEIFRGINPETGASDQQIDQIREVQAKVIEQVEKNIGFREKKAYRDAADLSDIKPESNHKKEPERPVQDGVIGATTLLFFPLGLLLAAWFNRDGKDKTKEKAHKQERPARSYSSSAPVSTPQPTSRAEPPFDLSAVGEVPNLEPDAAVGRQTSGVAAATEETPDERRAATSLLQQRRSSSAPGSFSR